MKTFLSKFLRFDAGSLDDHPGVVRAGLWLAACAVAIRLFFWAYTGRNWEDALITVLHSENFVRGLGLTHYRAGELPLHGFTSPFSVLIPLVGDLFRPGFGLSLIKLVSAFAGGLTVLYAMAIAIHPKVKLPVPLAFMAMGYLAFEHHQILWGMAGMETQVVTLVLIMSVYYLNAMAPIALGVSLGCCMLARPDFAFWTVIAGLCVLVWNWRALPKVVLPALSVYAPWIIFTTLYYGSPLPNTIVAKGLGYPLWIHAPGLTWMGILRRAAVSLFNPYSAGALFQPLGPCFGGQGNGFRPLWDTHGALGMAMMALALVGMAVVLIRRERPLIPVAGFVLVYGVYYVFFVAVIFGWYVVPFAAMALLLSLRGIAALGGLIRAPRVRTALLSAIAAGYVACFVVVLPTTFAAEKRIQRDVEDVVRKRMGTFLGCVMQPDQTVGCEPLGYVAYYSRRTVLDWPGLANRKVVEYSRTHPQGRSLMDMLEFFKPDFLALRYREYQDSFERTWIDTEYRIIASFEAPRASIQDIPGIEQNVDTGFLVLAKRDWKLGETACPDISIGMNPAHARAQVAVAMRLINQGKQAEAMPPLADALQIDPGDPLVHGALGLANAGLGKTGEAIRDFDRALELNPRDAMALNNRAVCRLQQGNDTAAMSDLQSALAADPAYVQAHVNLASLFARRGDFENARREFEAALEIDPKDEGARAGLERVRDALRASRPGT